MTVRQNYIFLVFAIFFMANNASSEDSIFSIKYLAPENYDLYIGSGNYGQYHNNDKHDGSFKWVKGQVRPLNINLKEINSGVFHYINALDVGVFGYGTYGDGDMLTSHYDDDKYAVGVTGKLSGVFSTLQLDEEKDKHDWDIDFDLGIGRHFNQSDNNGGLYQSRQRDNIYYIASHVDLRWREMNFDFARVSCFNKEFMLFPKTGITFESVIPYNEEHKHSWNNNSLPPSPYDYGRTELFIIQDVIDIPIWKFRFTPGIKAGIGREDGEQKDFYHIGGSVTFSQNTDSNDKKQGIEDVITISCTHKEQLGGEGDKFQVDFFINAGECLKKIGTDLKKLIDDEE